MPQLLMMNPQNHSLSNMEKLMTTLELNSTLLKPPMVKTCLDPTLSTFPMAVTKLSPTPLIHTVMVDMLPMLPTLVNHTTQNTSHTQPQLTSQLQYTTNQPHTTLKTDVVILSLNPA